MTRLILLALLALTIAPVPVFSGEPSPARSSRASASQIGAIMALLATLQDAGVLPPEDSPDANRIIHWAIQCQSVFMKSDDAAVQALAHQALTATAGASAATLFATLPSTGWTAPLLEALADTEARLPEDERQRLVEGFGRFNVSVDDFHRLMQLVREARQSFAQRGTDFRTQFDRRRSEMPGAGPREP